MISFIVPAHNEQTLIGRTIDSLHESAKVLQEPYEIVVVNDASTDQTAAIASARGARVIEVDCRQIAAVRNAGARQAHGDLFVFVDADTMVTARALRQAVRTIRAGAVGGGCSVRFDGPVPFYAMVMERVLPFGMQLFGLAAGCFFFCTREAYYRAGGFDESLFCTEEVDFSRRLKKLGRFVVLREFVITSARKLRCRTGRDLLKIGIRLARGGRPALSKREGLDYWYGAR